MSQSQFALIIELVRQIHCRSNVNVSTIINDGSKVMIVNKFHVIHPNLITATTLTSISISAECYKNSTTVTIIVCYTFIILIAIVVK